MEVSTLEKKKVKKKEKKNKPSMEKKKRKKKEKKYSLQPPIPPWKVRDPRSVG